MIRKIGQAFVLDTAHTTYAFSILPGGHPEHLYYGRTIHIEHPDDLEILVEKHVFAPGNVNICEKEHAGFSLEDVRLEMSSYGKGDIREPFVEAILYDGAKTLDFRYEDAVITGKKDALDGLPGSYGSVGEVQQAETVLILAFCAIFRRSGEAMTQMPVAGRTYRQITVTGIHSRR